MQIAIYGAGGFGREVRGLLAAIADQHTLIGQTLDIVGFIDDHAAPDATLGGLPVLTLPATCARFGPIPVALAIGDPLARRHAADRLDAAGCSLCTAIAPDVPIDPSLHVGDGAVICRGTTPTVDIHIGRGVQINLHCTIGHDAVLHDFVTLAPGVHVSGCVTIEADASIGTGAVIIHGRPDARLTIGRGAIVGAGACVIRSVPAGITVGGVPAKPL